MGSNRDALEIGSGVSSRVKSPRVESSSLLILILGSS